MLYSQAQQSRQEALIWDKMLSGRCDTPPPLAGPSALGMKEVHTPDKGFVSLPLAEDQGKAALPGTRAGLPISCTSSSSSSGISSALK